MEVNYTKEETLKLIEEYYKRLEDRQVKANITVEKGTIGYHEDIACITKISVTEVFDIGGMKKEVKIKISKEELDTLLRALFDLYGFELTSVTLNDGINTEYKGYGMMEQKVYRAYFKGINVNLNKKKNQTLNKVNK